MMKCWKRKGNLINALEMLIEGSGGGSGGGFKTIVLGDRRSRIKG